MLVRAVCLVDIGNLCEMVIVRVSLVLSSESAFHGDNVNLESPGSRPRAFIFIEEDADSTSNELFHN